MFKKNKTTTHTYTQPNHRGKSQNEITLSVGVISSHRIFLCLINEYDGREWPKDLQSNFGNETIRTVSDEETWARREINELLTLCDITRYLLLWLITIPLAPAPHFHLSAGAFVRPIRNKSKKKKEKELWVRKTDIIVSTPLPFRNPLIYCLCRWQPLASC